MTPPNKTSLQKMILANGKRLNSMGLHYRKDLQFIHKLSQSPFPETGMEYARKLHQILNQIEFSSALNGHESVPNLDPAISFEIGRTILKGLAYQIAVNGLSAHLIACGASGSGKTNVMNLIISEIHGQVPAILFDHKDEGLRFVNSSSAAAYVSIESQRWNCLAGVGNQKEYIRFISSQLVRLMALVPVTANAVQAKLISLCSDPNNLPSISDLTQIFFKLSQKEQRSVLNTAARGFDDLSANMGPWATVRQGHWPFDEHTLSVIRLKDCPPAFEHFLIALLFKQLTDRATSKGHTNAVRQLVIFDEGRGFFGKEMESGTASGRGNLQVDIMTKCRSYGIGIIIGTQSIIGIQQAVIDNAGILIALRTNSEQEAKACCRRLGLDESRYMELINMPTGMAWVVSPWCREPIKIRIPFRDLGHYPSEAEIINRMQPLWNSWNTRSTFSPSVDRSETTIDFREILGEKSADTASTDDTDKSASPEPAQTNQPSVQKPSDPQILSEYFALLRSCKTHPELGAAAHYKSLGWSGGRGNRVKNKLIELGWITAVRVTSPKGGRPKETLQITDKGEEVLNESA